MGSRSNSLVILTHSHLFLAYPDIRSLLHNSPPPTFRHDRCCRWPCTTDDVVAHSFPFRHRQRRNGAVCSGWQAGRPERKRAVFARASKASSAGRWIWQVRRAALLAAQEGQRTRGAATDLDGCDRESILIVFPSFFHRKPHPICTCTPNAASLRDKCCPGWGRRRRLLMPPARLALAHASVTSAQVQPGRHLGASSPEHHGHRRWQRHSLFAIGVTPLHAHLDSTASARCTCTATTSCSPPAPHPAYPVLTPPMQPTVMPRIPRSCPSA
jgi:hypothetical protein